MSLRTAGWALAASAALLAVGCWGLFGAGPLNYDGAYALLWGSQIADAHRPEFQPPLAPTPKPLLIALAAGLDAAGFGHGAEGALLALSIGSLGWLAAAAATVAWQVSGRWAALLAVAIIVTREPILSWALRGYSEVLFCALLVTTLALELRRPRAGAIGLLLLGVAGLLRPEAWLLALAYLAWCWPALRPGRRLTLAALATAAPLLWAALDLVATGVPWWSLTGTRATATTLARPAGIDALFLVAPRRIGEILREPVLAGVAAGIVLLLARPMRGGRQLAAAIAAVSAAFAALSAAGLPVIARYLLPVAVLLAILSASAVVELLRRGRPRKLRAVGILLAAWLIVAAPGQFERLKRTGRVLAAQRAITSELHAMADAGTLSSSCRPLSIPNRRALPSIAWWTASSAYAVRTDAHAPASGTALVAGPVARRLYVLDPRDPVAPQTGIPKGFAVSSTGRYWTVARRCASTG